MNGKLLETSVSTLLCFDVVFLLTLMYAFSCARHGPFGEGDFSLGYRKKATGSCTSKEQLLACMAW